MKTILLLGLVLSGCGVGAVGSLETDTCEMAAERTPPCWVVDRPNDDAPAPDGDKWVYCANPKGNACWCGMAHIVIVKPNGCVAREYNTTKP